MFETCKATVLLQKVDRLDASVLEPEEVLHLACRHGARLIGQENEIGSLEVGKKADLVVIDLMTAFAAPVHRVTSAIVYCSTPRDVLHVMVDGKLLIKNKEVTFTDEKEVIHRATECAKSVFEKAGIATRLI
jgi:5-methylthioadenosine/S-adenosylhomocysteine deaminase